MRKWIAGVAFAMLLLPRAAQASPLFELVGDVSDQGGFNARSTGAGSASTYFNPALLPYAKQSFSFGLMVLSDQISLTLDGRSRGNVPLVVGDRQINGADGQPISNATVPTDWLQHGCAESQCGQPLFRARPRQAAGSSGNTQTYYVLGLVSHLVDNKAVLGFHAIIPKSEFTAASSFYNDEREQFFTNSLHPELYSDRLTALSLAFGGGSEIVKNLSLGVSFTMNLVNNADAGTYVRDPSDYNQLYLDTDVGVHASVSPHFGVVYTPSEIADLSATLHTQQALKINTSFSAALPGGNESRTTRTNVHSFVPWTLSLGGALHLTPHSPNKFSLVGTALYARWSDYLDRHGESPGVDGPAFAWSDTLSGSLGGRFDRGPVRTHLDFTYVPSPVPLQVGRKNYVDNDRIGASAGGDYAFSLLGLDFRAGLMFQAHRLLHRYQKKMDSLIVDELPDGSVSAVDGTPIAGAAGLQTNNPGWPGFASEGWILAGSASLSLLY